MPSSSGNSVSLALMLQHLESPFTRHPSSVTIHHNQKPHHFTYNHSRESLVPTSVLYPWVPYQRYSTVTSAPLQLSNAMVANAAALCHMCSTHVVQYSSKVHALCTIATVHPTVLLLKLCHPPNVPPRQFPLSSVYVTFWIPSMYCTAHTILSWKEMRNWPLSGGQLCSLLVLACDLSTRAHTVLHTTRRKVLLVKR